MCRFTTATAIFIPLFSMPCLCSFERISRYEYTHVHAAASAAAAIEMIQFIVSILLIVMIVTLVV